MVSHNAFKISFNKLIGEPICPNAPKTQYRKLTSKQMQMLKHNNRLKYYENNDSKYYKNNLEDTIFNIKSTRKLEQSDKPKLIKLSHLFL